MFSDLFDIKSNIDMLQQKWVFFPSSFISIKYIIKDITLPPAECCKSFKTRLPAVLMFLEVDWSQCQNLVFYNLGQFTPR